MRFAVVNLGCKVNRVESDGFERLLLAAGGTEALQEEADLIVVNTCTVTAEADKKTRKAVRHALRANASARVAVTGCAAAIDEGAFASMDARVCVVPKAGMSLWLEDVARTEAAAAGAADEDVLPAAPGAGMPEAHEPDLALFSSRTRVGVKVQDGCDNACTYCIVHVARGRATSRPAPEVLAEAVTLAASGVREIVLSGINLGSYRWEDMRLAGLLEELLAATAHLHEPGEPPCRFRVSSVEPMDVDDDFISLLACADGRVCRHLHLPLQSGSTKVLREMDRPYTAEEFARLVSRLRAQVPALALTTDVIVGFPGETEGEFAETLEIARACAFSKIHVFPYSQRAGTPAAARADQVPPRVKSARAARLRALSDELRAADRARRAGTCELALVEEAGRAMTESYHETSAPAGANPGALVHVTL
ncbi:tRNA (N(6)-L-threonylcarbamoyladenosine(37)-C(2))-methylthiotransferase MtaB [Adlercreutzia sp. ZJ176]|uniref:tRNA (N(6)-L-threonylcarbamoyladenosine(37)-C(2))- methylthiotransferase MtaB n=2 Tax=unclassified Adlercreutzia TaxID=2636013 RepID=UPI0013EBBD80|nr:tRNA (N(6)-L-threonylcarbamoyladenosine(37)-C(2))-methylthiotransferase MtaB [Adlercreutzia sp. ZJ176]